MKLTLPFALFLAALAPVGAQDTATSPIVGYVTETLTAGQFNLIGLTLHEPAIMTGTLDVVGASAVTDTGAGFGSLLTAGRTYILEITDATSPHNGTIQEITAWSGDSLTTVQNFNTLGITVGTSYKLRAAKTIGDIFGATNSAGLLAGTANNADLILVPDGAGGFYRYFYSSGGFTGIGWRLVGGGAVSRENDPLVYTDAFFIQRRGLTNLNLVLTGEVKSARTSFAVSGSFEYVSSVYPAGVTLGNSGLEDSLLKGTANTADLILMPKPDGSYDRYFYSNGGFTGTGWRLVGGGGVSQSAVALKSGLIINRRQAAFNATITPPSY